MHWAQENNNVNFQEIKGINFWKLNMKMKEIWIHKAKFILKISNHNKLYNQLTQIVLSTFRKTNKLQIHIRIFNKFKKLDLRIPIAEISNKTVKLYL